MNYDIIRCHSAANLIFIKRCNQLDLVPVLLRKRFDHQGTLFLADTFEYFHSGIRIELGNDDSGSSDIHFIQIAACFHIIEILKNIRKHICTADSIEFLSLLHRKRPEHIGNIIAVVIIEPVHDRLRSIAAPDYVDDLRSIIGLDRSIFCRSLNFFVFH